MLKKIILITMATFCLASNNTTLESSLKEQNSTEKSKYNLGGNSGLIQAANDPLAPIAQVSFKEIYTGYIWKTPNGSANNLQIRTVAPMPSNFVLPFDSIARLTLNASTYRAGMPIGVGDTQLEY
jgi:hypothetical protein